MLTVKNKENSKILSLNKSLSIQFSLDGFSFCTTDIFSEKIISFTRYNFNKKIITPEKLLIKITDIFKNNDILQQDFKKIEVIHQNRLSTIVPNIFFNKEKLKKYLNFNIKTLENDYITFDEIKSINSKNIYIPFVNINNFLFKNFGEFEFKHHSTILIEKLINYSKKNLLNNFFVNVNTKNIDIVSTQNGKLRLYNSFQFNTKEDFIYYILFVYEQLKLDTNKNNLTFLGDIEKESDLFKITYTYIRNIDFIIPDSDFFSTSNDFLNHSNYILIS